MKKFKITDDYTMRTFWRKIIEIEAKDEDEAIEKYHEGLEGDWKLISDEEIESEYDGNCEIDVAEILTGE
jgi:hypothetical protein